MVFRPHLDHVELGDAVLLHTHGHGDAVFLDKHGESWWWGKGGSGRRLTRERGRGADGKEGERGQERLGGAAICDLSNRQLKSTLMVSVGEGQNKSIRDACCEKNWTINTSNL